MSPSESHLNNCLFGLFSQKKKKNRINKFKAKKRKEKE